LHGEATNIAETLVGATHGGEVGRHRDRHDRHERDVGQLVASVEITAERPRADAEHDVVDGRARRVLEALTSARLAAAYATRRRPLSAELKLVRGR